jgi:hypothetical protein
VNQHGQVPRQVLETPGIRVWRSRDPQNGDTYVAVFNLHSASLSVDLPWRDIGLKGACYRVDDLWDSRPLGRTASLRFDLAAHASALIRAAKE